MFKPSTFRKPWMIFSLLCMVISLQAQQIVSETLVPNSYSWISPGIIPMICSDSNDFTLVRKSVLLLQQDIERVSNIKPGLTNIIPAKAKNLIIIGSIERSTLIQRLIQDKKIDAGKIRNRWEGYQLQTVSHPFPGIENALVIFGSDRRGTAYGVLELSRQMGVSPWYWWADVPVKKKTRLFLKKNIIVSDMPKVKYRGIFINDEAPALAGWSREKFGGFNHLFYEKIFELMLRLRSNYIWPAMWGNAFYDDDSLNIKIADDYGIVIGTSHHEPLLRAHDEWRRYGSGKWNYDSNEVKLKAFWKEGMQRAKGTETIVSVGMRGDGDMPMTQGTAIALLERIVKDQREIIADVTQKDPAATPQLWALYKEVQNYYDQGMRVPDDVTLLLCDDNWGNIRKLPKLNEPARKGGYGVYYHFDYVGDPRNYKWINTVNIARVWEQMHLAYDYGVDKIWIVNVGDLKPLEFPVSFFLDYAWNPEKWNEDNLSEYFTKWAAQQFGETRAKEIGNLIKRYSQYNARRKPELLSPETYSLFNYNESPNIVNDYNKLLAEAVNIDQVLPPEYRDAFFELVLHPIEASANLNEMYLAAAKNRWFAERKADSTNIFADKVKQLYIKDSLISVRYNQTLLNGKWNHMMDQTHIGYTYWQQPPVNQMPSVEYVIPGSDIVLPATMFDSKNKFLESPVFNKAERNTFYERDGYVSMQAVNFNKAVGKPDIHWKSIPDIGRDGSGLTTFPVTVSFSNFSRDNPHVEYTFYAYDSGKVSVNLFFSPSLNYKNDSGLNYAVSIDDELPQIVYVNKDGNIPKTWEGWVADNIIIKSTHHTISGKGKHILKYWMISPALVLQKLVIDFGGVKPSYLGPPETIKK